MTSAMCMGRCVFDRPSHRPGKGQDRVISTNLFDQERLELERLVPGIEGVRVRRPCSEDAVVQDDDELALVAHQKLREVGAVGGERAFEGWTNVGAHGHHFSLVIVAVFGY